MFWSIEGRPTHDAGRLRRDRSWESVLGQWQAMADGRLLGLLVRVEVEAAARQALHGVGSHSGTTSCSSRLLRVLDGPSASASPSGSRRLFSNALASGGVIVVVVRRLTHSLMVRTRCLLPRHGPKSCATAQHAHRSMSASPGSPVVADVPVGRTLPILGLPVPF